MRQNQLSNFRPQCPWPFIFLSQNCSASYIDNLSSKFHRYMVFNFRVNDEHGTDTRRDDEV